MASLRRRISVETERLTNVDDIERAAIAAEGYDPDDPAVVGALARVSAVLAELGPRSGLERSDVRGFSAVLQHERKDSRR